MQVNGDAADTKMLGGFRDGVLFGHWSDLYHKRLIAVSAGIVICEGEFDRLVLEAKRLPSRYICFLN